MKNSFVQLHGAYQSASGCNFTRCSGPRTCKVEIVEHAARSYPVPPRCKKNDRHNGVNLFIWLTTNLSSDSFADGFARFRETIAFRSRVHRLRLRFIFIRSINKPIKLFYRVAFFCEVKKSKFLLTLHRVSLCIPFFFFLDSPISCANCKKISPTVNNKKCLVMVVTLQRKRERCRKDWWIGRNMYIFKLFCISIRTMIRNTLLHFLSLYMYIYIYFFFRYEFAQLWVIMGAIMNDSMISY